MRDQHSQVSLTPSARTQPNRLRFGLLFRRHPWIVLGVLLTIALVVGCAQQYHSYRCGCDCVNYNYCPPAPLPNSPYCSCPTPISNAYQRARIGQQHPSELGHDPSAGNQDAATSQIPLTGE